MLLRFAVANHLSIRDRQEILFSASSLKDPKNGLIHCKSVSSGSVLPAMVIYGANASGKTNILNAIEVMKDFVLRSHTHGEAGGGVPREVFKLDEACLKVPSKFEIDFIVEGVTYHYGFEATDEIFVAEWLYAYPSSYGRMLFERENDQFKFGRTLKGQNKHVANTTRPNSLFLSAAVQNNHQQLLPVYNYFKTIKIAKSVDIRGVEASIQFAGDELDRRVIEFLTFINTGVVDYQKKITEIPEETRAVMREMNAAFRKLIKREVRGDPGDIHERISIELAHRNNKGELVFFNLDSESAGTRRLLVVLSAAYKALDEGLLLCVDELESSLHTFASEAVLKLFCSPELNRKGAQLLATTHDTNLMKSSALRRDQLWFTEKTSDGVTELFPLTEIQTRKGDNIELGYLQGRYGAVPNDDMVLY